MADITASEYQQWVELNWNRLGFEREPNQLRELFIMSVGLGGEAGEVQELLKKFVRDDREIHSDLRLELGDVLHYLTRIASQFGMTLEEIMMANRSKIERRHAKRLAQADSKAVFRGDPDNQADVRDFLNAHPLREASDGGRLG